MKHGEYLLGLVCILLVTCLRVFAGLTTDVTETYFSSPFTVTYYHSLFFQLYLIFYLPMLFSRCTNTCDRKGRCSQPGARSKSNVDLRKVSVESLSETGPVSQVEQDTIVVDLYDGEVTNHQRIHQNGPDWNEKPLSSFKDSDRVTCCFCFIVKERGDRIFETAKHSAILSLVFFTMLYSYNVSLMWTPLETNDVLSAGSGLFCLILSVVFLKESFVWIKIVGVASVVCGMILIAREDGDNILIVRDLMATLSAFVYACFSTLLGFRLKNDKNISMCLFFGLIGFFNMIFFWPFMLIFHCTGVETMELLDKVDVLEELSMAGFTIIISNFLWAKSILLTSPVVATVGLSLSIPVVPIIEIIMFDGENATHYVVGSVCVFVGFLLVNLKGRQSLEPEIVHKRSSRKEVVLKEALLKDEQVP